jgi:3-oxoadipate enol-lactonase
MSIMYAITEVYMKISINNSIINCTDNARSQGLPIIFIHGFPFSLEMWKPQLSELSAGFRLISYDIRGHGASAVGDGQYTIDLFADDLIALIDYLSIKRPVLCGLSMGGYIALRTFERHPERIGGLILCDTKSESDTNEAKTKRFATMKIIKESGIDLFAGEFVKSVFCENTFSHKPEIVDEAIQIIRRNSPLGICGAILALASRTDTTQILPSINVPTCIVAGEHDRLTPPAVAESMHKVIPGSKMHVVPNAGHMCNIENSGEFNNILLSFLKTFKQ